MDKIKAFFTAPRRKAIYQVSIAIGGALVAFKVITLDDITSIREAVTMISEIVLTLTGILAVNNVTPDE